MHYTLVSVISSPLMDVTMIIPTRMKEICWDQNLTCHQNRKHSRPLVPGRAESHCKLITCVTMSRNPIGFFSACSEVNTYRW